MSQLHTLPSFLIASWALCCGFLPGQSQEKENSNQAADSLYSTTIPYTLTSEDILRQPGRDLRGYLLLFPGIVQQNGSLHIRGGRTYDIGHTLNGIPLTNRFFGGEAITTIPEATEELKLYPGGMSATMGMTSGALVATTMRRGGGDLNVGAHVQTDGFVQTGSEFAGTTSFGYRNTVLTVDGPVPSVEGLRVFLAGENTYMRNRQPMFLEPMHFQLVTDQSYYWGPDLTLPAPVAFERNLLPNNRSERNTIQGTAQYDMHPLRLNLAGSYQFHAYTLGSEWPTALVRVFNQRRNPSMETGTGFLSATMTHNLDQWLHYNASLTYFGRSGVTVDPDFGTDWKKFTDSVENAARGYTGFVRRWTGPLQYSVINGFRINHENAPSNSFTRDDQRAWILTANGTASVADDWTINAGGHFELWRFRRFDVRSIEMFMSSEYLSDGTPRQFPSDLARRAYLGWVAGVNHYGYDIDGNVVDDGYDEPRTAQFGSAYIDNAFVHDDIRVSAGLRLEHYDPNFSAPADPTTPDFLPMLDVLDESKLVDQPAVRYLLPRFGLSYASATSTTLHVAFGKYVQFPPLRELYAGNTLLSRTISPLTSGNAFLPPAGFLVRPERSTQYELGIRQAIAHSLRVGASLFYKDIVDLLAVARLQGAYGSYLCFTNSDRATSKGVEVSIEFLRRKGFAATLFYTLSDASGSGSEPWSHIGMVEQGLPIELILGPLDFQQTHKATVIIDYRAGEDASPVISGTNAMLIASFASGHRYTQVQMPTFGGLSNPWNNGVQSLVDPRTASPVEPLNQSSTPPMSVVDLRIGKKFNVGSVGIEVYAIALNLFNTKTILNVYPTTGNAQDDGWLGSNTASTLLSVPHYAAFYRAINLQNRWAFMTATGNDIYGTPRQMRIGVSATI